MKYYIMNKRDSLFFHKMKRFSRPSTILEFVGGFEFVVEKKALSKKTFFLHPATNNNNTHVLVHY